MVVRTSARTKALSIVSRPEKFEAEEIAVAREADHPVVQRANRARIRFGLFWHSGLIKRNDHFARESKNRLQRGAHGAVPWADIGQHTLV
jgi:hypothetical protein